MSRASRRSFEGVEPEVAGFHQIQGALGLGGLVRPAESAGDVDQGGQVVGQELPIGRVRGVGGQGLALPLDGLAEPDACLREPARFRVEERQVMQRACPSLLANLGDSGCVLRQLLEDRSRPTRRPFGPRPGLPRFPVRCADVAVADRQLALKLGDRRVGVDQLLLDLPAPTRTPSWPRPACRSAMSRRPML